MDLVVSCQWRRKTHTPLAQFKTEVYLLNRITERIEKLRESKSHSQVREGLLREEKAH